jgi:predicted amidohydrolase
MSAARATQENVDMETITVAAAAVRNFFAQPDAAIDHLRSWVARAAEQNVELLLFPELSVSGYSPTPVAAQIAEPVPGPSVDKMIALAAWGKMTLAFGLLERAEEKIYCTHVLVDGNGVIGKQRKIHVPAQEAPFWSAGDAIEVFDMGKVRVGVAICRDAFFDEMTRTLYFKGAEMVLMPFGYYNVERSRYLKESIHGMSLVKAAWTNGYYALVCNSAGERAPNEWEPEGRKFPGWAGVISPWGRVISFVDRAGNDEALVVETLDPEELCDRREHPNFLARELRLDLYQFEP